MKKRRKVQRSKLPSLVELNLELSDHNIDLVESEALWTFKCGGYNSGKTYGVDTAAILAALKCPGKRGLLAAPTSNHLRSPMLDTFEEIAGDLIVDWNKNEKWYELLNGFRFYYGSADHPRSLEGKHVCVVAADEISLFKERAFSTLLFRLRQEAPINRGYLGGTPDANTWLRKLFDGKNEEVYRLIRVSTTENPYASEQFIKNSLDYWDEETAKAFVYGEWLSVSNAIYQEFSRETHMVPFQPVPGVPVIGGVDFGGENPAVVFAQKLDHPYTAGNKVLRPGSIVVFAEDVSSKLATEYLAKRIGTRFVDEYGKRTAIIEWLGCDPAGQSKESTASALGRGMSDINALRSGLADCGISPQLKFVRGPGSRMVRSVGSGIQQIRGLLRNAAGVTKLYFADSLLDTKSNRGIITAMETYRWNRDGTSPLKGERGNHVDHVADALRYLVRHAEMGTSPRILRAA